MNVSSIAASALISAGTATAVRANNIAIAQTEGFKARAPVYGSTPNGGVAVFVQDTNNPPDLLRETIGLMVGSHQYASAAKLIAVDDQMQKRLLKAFA